MMCCQIFRTALCWKLLLIITVNFLAYTEMFLAQIRNIVKGMLILAKFFNVGLIKGPEIFMPHLREQGYLIM